jgi:hypothetical protein
MSLRERIQSLGLRKYLAAIEEEAWEWDDLVELHYAELLEVAEDCGMDEADTSKFVDYVLLFAGPLSSPEVLIDVGPPPLVPPGDGGLRPRLALACMTKRPGSFEAWLRHHRERVGVEHFFVRVEETPELSELFSLPPWDTCVHATFSDGRTARDCGGLQCARQDQHVRDAITHARALGCTHLMHCDDDELFYVRRCSSILRPLGRALPVWVC